MKIRIEFNPTINNYEASLVKGDKKILLSRLISVGTGDHLLNRPLIQLKGVGWELTLECAGENEIEFIDSNHGE